MKSEKYSKFVSDLVDSRSEIVLKGTGSEYKVFTWNPKLGVYEESHHTTHWSSYATMCEYCGSWDCQCDMEFKRYTPSEMVRRLMSLTKWELESLLPEGCYVGWVVGELNKPKPIIGYAVFTADREGFMNKFGGEECLFYRDNEWGSEDYIIVKEESPDRPGEYSTGVFLEL